MNHHIGTVTYLILKLHKNKSNITLPTYLPIYLSNESHIQRIIFCVLQPCC